MRCLTSRLVLWLILPAALQAQRGSITGVVVARETKEPLAYALVAVPSAGRDQFTTDSGAFRIADLPPGPVVLTVRRLGYSPRDVTVQVADRTTTIVVELTRIAVQLGTVTVQADPRCANPGAPSDSGNATLLTLFSQLQLNAQQFRTLTATYPFVSAMNAVRATKEPRHEPVAVGHSVIEVESRRDQWPYQPGKVVTRRQGDYIFNIPTLVQFADARFIAEHCFHYAGIDTISGMPLLRLDFLAADRVREPDVKGSLFLDPDTYQIRRSMLRLTRLPPVAGMSDFIVVTEFAEVMESIPVISRIFSAQLFDTRRSPRKEAVYEEWQLLNVKWVKKKPGQDSPRDP